MRRRRDEALQRLRDRIARFGAGLRSNEVLTGTATALAIKLTGAILNFVMLALLSRQITPAAFGSFAIIFNAVGLMSALALCGQELLITRAWGEYVCSNRPALARGVLIFGIQVVSIAALVASVIVAIGWPQLDKSLSIPLLLAACAFLIAQTLMRFSGQFARVAAGVVIGDGPREILWRAVLVAAILACQAAGTAFGAVEFFFVAAGGLALGIVIQVTKVAPFIPEAVRQTRPQGDLGAWIACSFRMWLSNLVEVVTQYLEVVVIGLVLGPTTAAFFFVATRITTVFAVISAGITMYATSVIGALYYSGAKAKLQSMLHSLALVNTILAIGALAVIAVAGKLMLWFFGPAYVSAYWSLVVLAGGAAVSAIAGPAGNIMVLTGREGAYPAIMAVGLGFRFLLFLILGPAYGLLGVAFAWSISAVALAVALTIACRRLVGLDPSPGMALAKLPADIFRLRESKP